MLRIISIISIPISILGILEVQVQILNFKYYVFYTSDFKLFIPYAHFKKKKKKLINF